MITDEQLDNWFNYHPPGPLQQGRYVVLRQAARDFAGVLRAAIRAGDADESEIA